MCKVSRRQDPTRSDDFLVHQEALRRLARALDSQSADDLLHETWIRAVGRGPHESPERSLWLRGVLRNVWRMDRRTRARRAARESAAAVEPSPDPTPEGVLERREDVERLLDGIDALPPRLQSVLRRRYIEGLSAAEIARRDHMPAGTVRRQLKDALDRLRGHDKEPVAAVVPFFILPGLSGRDIAVAAKVAVVKTSTKAAAAVVLASVFVGGGLVGRALDEPARTELALPSTHGGVLADDSSSAEGPSSGGARDIDRPALVRDRRVSELEARVASLEEELAIARATVSLVEQNNPLSRRFFNLTDEEKRAMAKQCEIRTDLPGPASEELARDIDLTDEELDAWNRAWARYDASTQRERVALWSELTGERISRVNQLEVSPHRLEEIIAQTDPNLIRRLAEERAGMRPRPTEAELETLSAADRWVRLDVEQGDEFERYLADEIGTDRARELRTATDGWSAGRMHRDGCPE
jgi:RNA polymerase sigma-70 factor, ECF subfamily